MFLSPEQRAAMDEATERFKAGEVDEIELEIAGGQILRMVRDADSPMGMRIELPGADFEPPHLEVYPPSEERPPGLPDWAPFLPDSRIIVTDMPGPKDGSMVNFIRKGPWGDDIDSMLASFETEGWTGGPAEAPENSEKYRAEWEELGRKHGASMDRLEKARAEYEKTERDHYEYVRDGRKRRLTVMSQKEGSTMVMVETDDTTETDT